VERGECEPQSSGSEAGSSRLSDDEDEDGEEDEDGIGIARVTSAPRLPSARARGVARSRWLPASLASAPRYHVSSPRAR